MASKLQCVITSYMRPKYLRPTLESMRAGGDVELYVVDGGGSDEALKICRDLADDFVIIPDNPGADILKNEGIRRFVSQPEFCITSDDFLYPAGWAAVLLERWSAFRSKFAMLASPTELVIERHTQAIGHGRGQGYHYVKLDWVKPDYVCMPTSVCMVAGTMMDTERTLKAGGFPVYGKSGQGDIAISRVFRSQGFEVGYLRDPVLKHLGQSKEADYPQYTADFDADDDVWQARARKHDGLVRGPLTKLLLWGD